MNSNALRDTSDVLIQFCFFAPLAFLVIYSFRCPWWHTVHGRTLAALALVFVVALFRGELFVWGLLPRREEPDADVLAWMSVCALILVPVAFATLIWQLIRKPLRTWGRWIKGNGTDNPLTSDAPRRLDDYQGQRSGGHVGPASDVDRVNSSPEE